MEKFIKQPSSQQFLDKMTELVKAYTSNGYVSEEQYELVLFKKARAILQIEYDVSKQKAVAESIISGLLRQQRQLNRECRDRVNSAHIAYQTDEMLASARKEAAIMQEKRAEFQQMMETYEQQQTKVLQKLAAEGYSFNVHDEEPDQFHLNTTKNDPIPVQVTQN